jgi:hypothetical protein
MAHKAMEMRHRYKKPIEMVLHERKKNLLITNANIKAQHLVSDMKSCFR